MAQVCGHMAGGRAMWAAVAAAAAAVLAALAAASDCGVATGAASLSDPMWTGFHNTLVGNVRQEDGGPNVRQDVAPFACSVYPEPALYVLPVCFTSCAVVACMHEVVWRVRRAARTSYSTVTASRSSGAARSGGATPGWGNGIASVFQQYFGRYRTVIAGCAGARCIRRCPTVPPFCFSGPGH